MKKTAFKPGCPAKFGIVSVLAIGLLFLCSSSFAQDRFSMQFRPGVLFATTEFGDANLKTGLGFEVLLAYHFVPHLSAYCGWGWNRFPATESFAGNNLDFEETGYSIGLQFMHPFSEGFVFDYFVKAGIILNHIEAENPKGVIVADSGRNPGFQVEAGMSFPLSDRWRLIPGIKYQSLPADFELQEMIYPVDLNHLSAGVTMAWSF